MIEQATVLIVEDDEIVNEVFCRALTLLGHRTIAARSLERGVAILSGPDQVDLTIVDVGLGDGNGFELLRRFRYLVPETEFIMTSGTMSLSFPVEAMREGAAGYLIKPSPVDALRHEVNRVLMLRRSLIQERDERSQLQSDLEFRTRELLKEHGVKHAFQRNLINCLCRLAEYRDNETGSHIHRMAEYCRHLANALRHDDTMGTAIDDRFIIRLHTTAPLHDIGKAAIPDAVLLKPGRLTDQEMAIMRTHSLIGRDILRDALSGVEEEDAQLIRMGMDICAAHHEKWNGTGYPNGLAGEQIPLPARIAALADFYDALSTPRVYRPEGFPHEKIRQMILDESENHFDPIIVQAFLQSESQFLRTRAKAEEMASRGEIPLPRVALSTSTLRRD